MKIKNITSLIAVFFLFALNVIALDFTDAENQQIQEVMEFRFETRQYATDQEAIDAIRSYRQQKLEALSQSDIGEEAKLTVENMLIIAECTYLFDSDADADIRKNLILPQYRKSAEWNKNHPLAKANPYYITSFIDILNSSLQFLLRGEMIKLGLDSRKYNDMLRKNFPEFALAYIGSGLWYQTAPEIGGGSKSFAKECFQKAIQKAKCRYERFYAYINYSQVCFEAKKIDECKKYLDAAENLLPGCRYISFIRKLNESGLSLFYYSNNKRNIDTSVE